MSSTDFTASIFNNGAIKVKIMNNNIILKITEKEKETVEKESNKNNYRVKHSITEKNETLQFNKNAIKFLQENGVKLEKVYYSKNANTTLYNTLYTIVKNNSDIFTLVEQ